MVFLPVKPLGPFESMFMRERANGSNIADQSFTIFYFKRYFVSDMKYFVVMDIYFFIYNVLGGETFILCST